MTTESSFSSLERPIIIAVLVAVAGVAAGTAAAVTATVFPYALSLALKGFRSKPHKTTKDAQGHASSARPGSSAKPDTKAKSSSRAVGTKAVGAGADITSTSASEGSETRDAVLVEVKRRKEVLQRSIIPWQDIEVTFDKFPYFLSDVTKAILVNSTFVRLRRSSFLQHTPTDQASNSTTSSSSSSRILLTAPPGSERYQELLVKALARHLRVRLLIFDSAALALEPPLETESSNPQEDAFVVKDREAGDADWSVQSGELAMAGRADASGAGDGESGKDSALGEGREEQEQQETRLSCQENGASAELDMPHPQSFQQPEGCLSCTCTGAEEALLVECVEEDMVRREAGEQEPGELSLEPLLSRPEPLSVTPVEELSGTQLDTVNVLDTVIHELDSVNELATVNHELDAVDHEPQQGVEGDSGRPGTEETSIVPKVAVYDLGLPAHATEQQSAGCALALAGSGLRAAPFQATCTSVSAPATAAASAEAAASAGAAADAEAAAEAEAAAVGGVASEPDTIVPSASSSAGSEEEESAEVPGAPGVQVREEQGGSTMSVEAEGEKKVNKEAKAERRRPENEASSARTNELDGTEGPRCSGANANRAKSSRSRSTKSAAGGGKGEGGGGAAAEAEDRPSTRRVSKRAAAAAAAAKEVGRKGGGGGGERSVGEGVTGGCTGTASAATETAGAAAATRAATRAAAADHAQSTSHGSSTSSTRKALRKGDRVKFVGASTAPSALVSSTLLSPGLIPWGISTASSRGPPVGAKGKVVLVLDESPMKVGVRFDKPFVGGTSLLDLCEDGHGCFCSVPELRLEGSSSPEDLDKLTAEALIEVVLSEASKEPLILLVKNVESSVLGHHDKYLKLEKLDKVDVVVIGAHTTASSDFTNGGPTPQRKDKLPTAGGKNSGFAALLDLSILDQISSRLDDPRAPLDGSSKSLRTLTKIFPCRIPVRPPQDEKAVQAWAKSFEADSESLRARANSLRLRSVMQSINVQCRAKEAELEELCASMPGMPLLSQDVAERIVGWAVSRHLQETKDPELVSSSPVPGGRSTSRLWIGMPSLKHAVALFMASQQPTTLRTSLKDISCDSEFETTLLSEVVPPEELGVSFESIGALESVKETLREVVMLPLQRPELFKKSQLNKPVRGLLLFGPPGTGKTMLAKAVATESGANFIDVSMSSIASKWFGEAEKYVKAVFTLAAKIAPCVIFVDEVDSMLGRRGKDTEHSAMRKLKNEFMSSWDGLRTKESQRILVLGATNRPFDLDDAVVRRFPRRIMIDVPDAPNRAKILRVILQDEDLADDVDIQELARCTEGYTGSDLRNLCVSAAFLRIKDFLKEEDKRKKSFGAASDKGRGAQVNDTAKGNDGAQMNDGAPELRPISMADMRAAMEKVRASVCMDAGAMQELTQWNEQYGEGGTGKKMVLSYFM